MSKHLEDVKRYDKKADEAVVAAIVKHLGIALRSRDASLVSCSQKKELDRVRTSWMQRKLGIEGSDKELDAAIQKVCETMKKDRAKKRVTFYYLIAANAGKLSKLA